MFALGSKSNSSSSQNHYPKKRDYSRGRKVMSVTKSKTATQATKPTATAAAAARGAAKPVASFVGEKNEHGERHGKGIETYINGDTYEGEWVANKKHGQGMYTWAPKNTNSSVLCPQEVRYVGAWENDLFHGEGCFYYASGNVFKGIFEHGLKSCAEGTMIFASGTTVKAPYANGKRTKGTGSAEFKQGSQPPLTFQGEFDERGIISGTGSLWQKEQAGTTSVCYTGEFLNGNFHGVGKLTVSNKPPSSSSSSSSAFAFSTTASPLFEYEGQFVHGAKHGFGKETDKKGTYEGRFVHDARTDKGAIFRSKSGDVYTGSYLDGERTGFGTLFLAKGGNYSGEFEKSLYHGLGEYRFSNGAVYKGEWRFNKKEGYGEEVYASGSSYRGNFKDGLKHGEGTYLWNETGKQYTGSWMDDMRSGLGEETYPFSPNAKGSSNKIPLRSTHVARFVGHWISGKKDGAGREFDLDGQVLWVGSFRLGKKDVARTKTSSSSSTTTDFSTIPYGGRTSVASGHVSSSTPLVDDHQ